MEKCCGTVSGGEEKMKIETESFKEEGIVSIDMIYGAIGGLGERFGVKLGELDDRDFVSLCSQGFSCGCLFGEGFDGFIFSDKGRIARL